MKRSEIRERSTSLNAAPDYAPFHPGYEEEKEAERRKTLFRNHRNLRCGTRPTGRARLPAFHRGSYQRESSSLRRSSGQASWIRSPKAAHVPPAPYPLTASTSHAGHSAGRLMPEPPESKGDEPLPAGTALAPPADVTRMASFASEVRFARLRLS